LDPIVRALPARITKLQISPDGGLYRVPFDALRLADDRYAVERYAISLVPSATVAQVLAAMPRATNAPRLVAVGDPDFRIAAGVVPGGLARGTDTTRFGGLTLARLPQSANEARRVAAYSRASVVLTRGGATKQALQSADLASVGVLHFATHALVDPQGQSRTALALTPSRTDDGFLTTSEIASLPLHGTLVILSACESLGGQILGGEGLRGLSEPFLEAGALAVVVTQWSIGDRSVLPFVDRFYAAMAAGSSVGDALRQTKLAAIRAGGRFADWAAFTVIGDASMHPPLRPR
jgi:CHAT domain-containing protein